MPRRKTHEEFVNELHSIFPNIDTKDCEYINNKTKLHFVCNVDGCEWDECPADILKGRGCPVCTGRRIQYNSITIQSKIDLIHNNTIKIIDEFRTINHNVKCQCLICGCIWHPRPHDLLAGSGCPRCNKNEKYTTNSFKEKMLRINPNLNITGLYVNSHFYIEYVCRICGHHGKSTPHNLLKGHGCPRCRKSKGESRIENYLNINNICFESQFTFDNLFGVGGNLLSYDFYLPTYNLLIEFQGIQHESPIDHFGGDESFEIQIEHDKRKREYAFLNNIQLIEIWYWDYNKIEQILNKQLNINNNQKSA